MDVLISQAPFQGIQGRKRGQRDEQVSRSTRRDRINNVYFTADLVVSEKEKTELRRVSNIRNRISVFRRVGEVYKKPLISAILPI